MVRPYDTVSRLGGDEFVVMLEQLGTDRAAAVATAERTAAKEAGRNIVRVFQPEMQQRVDRRAALESRLRASFARDELDVHYQAQVDAEGRIVGAEALMRWVRGGTEATSPTDFIPVAEESGFVHELGRWSLETVCGRIARWEPLLPPDFRVAVNLSAPEFMHPDFVARVLETLRRTEVHGRRIKLEITEARWSPSSASPPSACTNCVRTTSSSRSTTSARATARSPTSAACRSTR